MENVGVSFQEVPRGSWAAFRVVYKSLPNNGNKNALAEAFFPNAGDPNSRTLYIYALAFAKQYKKNQANFLAHEIGHILGLRHEFAPENEAFSSSVTLRGRNDKSVMNYYPDTSQFIVRQQDLDGLRALYDLSKTQFGGKPVRRFKVVNFKYPLIGE